MKKLFSVALLLTAMTKMQAGDAGLQLSLIPSIALEGSETTIHGLTLNLLCGENPQQGVTLGFYNIITGDSAGFTFGTVNYSATYTGVQWGLLNLTKNNFTGWQFGGINYAGTEFKGLQSGIINVADHCTGLQLGVVNSTDSLKGLQIGALNITTQNRWFSGAARQLAPVWPVVNWSF